MLSFQEYLQEVKEPTGKLKDACWTGYTAVGMKMKNGKKVPNCVPKNEEVVAEGSEDHHLFPDYMQKILKKVEASPEEKARNAARAAEARAKAKPTTPQKHEPYKPLGGRDEKSGRSYSEGVVAEGAPIVVALPPIHIRNPKKAPQTYRNQGDIVPPTQPPSTEKRGVKGRPGQRPMPTYEEFDAQFDLIEEYVEELALTEGLDPEFVWETLELVTDDELLEAAVDAKGHKSSTGGLTQKGRDYYNRQSGGNLQAPVTTPPSKLKPGSKAANRRKSFCARMSGVDGPMKKPNGEPTRKALALRKWNC
jgi:hypothetical protein